MDDPRVLDRASELAAQFLSQLPGRPVGRPIAPEALHATLGLELSQHGEDPVTVLEALAEAIDPGVVASAGPRYFGFVIGGSLPVTVATAPSTR